MKETQNLTLRLFDAIGVHQTAKDLRQNLEYNEEERRTDKTELRKEYSMPEILKQDIFKTCQVYFLGVFKHNFFLLTLDSDRLSMDPCVRTKHRD